jgi:NAD(P)-dependent dehydrogenase (short-subunit alcohol dehydrogenase family)
VSVLFVREGADVAMVYLPVEQTDAEKTAEAIRAERRRALLMPGDVSDPEFCVTAITQTVTELGRLDVLANNAAYQQHRCGSKTSRSSNGTGHSARTSTVTST